MITTRSLFRIATGRFPAMVATALLAIAACTPESPTMGGTDAGYLYLWTASADSTQPDFLAVLDVTESSGRYGRLVTTLPVPGLGNGPHHTEHELHADRQLFANGYDTGQTFIFDLTNPALPKLAGQFGSVDGFTHPHSFLRMPGGNVLATFQMQHDAAGMSPGGLVELTPSGQLVRASSANGPGTDPDLRAYSGAIVPSIDRIVTTTTDMDVDFPASRQLQLWRLSDLALLHTFTLPDGPAGNESMLTAEPRVLADGRTVLVSTFNCGLYLLDGLEGDSPSGRMVASWPRKDGTSCAIPIVAGNHYLMTVPAWNALVSMDISNPAAPREASRVTFSPEDVPHWISISGDRKRVAVTGFGGMKHRVMMVMFNPETGQLTLDDRFREEGATEPGFRFDNKTWPHGGSTKGVPHGVVFSRRQEP